MRHPIMMRRASRKVNGGTLRSRDNRARLPAIRPRLTWMAGRVSDAVTSFGDGRDTWPTLHLGDGNCCDWRASCP